MATFDTLEEIGSLVRIEVRLELDVQPWRILYGTPDFVHWLDGTLPIMETTVIGGEISPMEQVDAVFNEYISGEAMLLDRRFKKLSCTPDRCVWEFKTLDVRVFGWVPTRDHFICTFGDHKDEIELKCLYGRYIAQTVYVRCNLDLDDPKFVSSKEYKDVLSDA